MKAVGMLIGVSLSFWITAIRPIDGKYHGPVLDALALNATMVVKDGKMYIKIEDGEVIPYGLYFRRDGVYNVRVYVQTGKQSILGPDEWRLDRKLFGFELISLNGSMDRYRFTKSWRSWLGP